MLEFEKMCVLESMKQLFLEKEIKFEKMQCFKDKFVSDRFVTDFQRLVRDFQVE